MRYAFTTVILGAKLMYVVLSVWGLRSWNPLDLAGDFRSPDPFNFAPKLCKDYIYSL